jgi:D-3-phosphoglycerate dehydrogenase / 2-oxoglutarate reductase
MSLLQQKVLIAAPVHDVLIEGLTTQGYTIVQMPEIKQEQAFGLIGDCVGVVTSTRLQLDKKLLDAASSLKWIGRMGSGMEVVDLVYAHSKGIYTFSSPEGNRNAVAEHALGMLLSLIRRIGVAGSEIRDGKWLREENRGTELEGKTIGIIGFGHTGAAFAKKLRGFDMNILAYDKYCPDTIPEDIVRCDGLDRIYEEADIVSFHVPLAADTIYYFDESFVRSMRRPFILINTSRGNVVDTNAVKVGMERGKILGACLDVVEEEPLTAMSPMLRTTFSELATMPNVVLTPHIAGYTHEALYKMSKILLEKLLAIAIGK